MPFTQFLSHSWEVLTLFLIPAGGGVPAGVALAKSNGLAWPVTTFLYFLSDVIMAFAFEPLMLGFTKLARHSDFLRRFAENYKAAMKKAGLQQGLNPNPFSLILVAFAIDPMVARAGAKAAGYGFVSSWSLAICGDMISFAILMVATLWLGDVMGDGNRAAWILTGVVLVFVIVKERWKNRRAGKLVP